MKVESHKLGTLIETDTFLALLGNRESGISQLQQAFPQIIFKRIKQVHKDKVVHTSPHSIDFASEADAHYTGEKNLGLCISTADCIPILLYHHEPRWIASIHAGWRGVENRILIKAVQSLKKNGCNPSQLRVFVGPHIQKPSFEVGNDVRDLLLKSFTGEKETIVDQTSENKAHLDLHEIIKLQMLECEISLENVTFELRNTVTDLSYHSFRRDKENSGRQISFIALKN